MSHIALKCANLFFQLLEKVQGVSHDQDLCLHHWKSKKLLQHWKNQKFVH